MLLIRRQRRRAQALARSASDLEESEHQARQKLIRGAKAGDVGALCILQERYRIRLPLIEVALRIPFPWLKVAKAGEGRE